MKLSIIVEEGPNGGIVNHIIEVKASEGEQTPTQAHANTWAIGVLQIAQAALLASRWGINIGNIEAGPPLVKEFLCMICKEQIASPEEQERHLVEKHPGPFTFWHDCRKYTTDKPSMLVMDLKKLVICSPQYHMYEEREGQEDVFRSDGMAVDLTHEPHFFSVPPATYLVGGLG